MIIIKGNKGENIGGDLISIEAPHNVSIDISENEGLNILGDLVNLKMQVNQDSLSIFVAEASKHFHELSPEQLETFNTSIASLNSSDSSNEPALQWLYELSLKVSGSVIGSIILKFLGVGS